MKASLIPRLSPSRRSALAFLLSLLFAAGGTVLGDGLACTGCGNCQIFSASQGSFTHSSSSDVGYGNNWDCEWIIAPADRQSGVEVRFDSFSTEGCCDFVSVQSCRDVDSCANGTQLVRLSGVHGAGELSFTSATGVMRLSFASDSAINSEGFSASWNVICPRANYFDKTVGECKNCTSTCRAGTYMSECPLGSTSDSRECLNCTSGTYQSNSTSAATSCTACVAGTYAQSGGASACSECPAGSYCEAGSTQPRACFNGDGSWSDAGSDEEGDCVCDAGRYKDAVTSAEVSTLTGGPSLYGFADGSNSTARFRNPYGVAVSSDGRYAVVSDYGNHVLRLVDLETANTTTLAGRSDGISSSGYVNGARDAARFYRPRGVASNGSIVLVTDSYNHVIRQVDMATGFTSTLAGHPSSQWAYGYQDGSAASAKFYYPWDVAISGDGSVAVVSDYLNHCLRKIIVATGHTSTLAGPGWRTSGLVDGAAGDARFYYPSSLAMLEDSVYVIDQSNSAIRRTDLITGQTSTLVSAARGSMYGIGMGAGVDGWRGVVSIDYGLYRLNVGTGAMELLAGYNGTGYGCGFVDGDGLEARFCDNVYGISVTGDRAVVADYSNHAVRSVSMQPSCRACTAACGDGQYLSGPCARGSTQDTVSCVTCGAGTYKSGMSNATSCLACSASCGAGSYLLCRGSEDCAGCGAGTFQGNESSVATACTACVAGTYAQSGGASACSECPAGSYCKAGSAQPRECVPYSWSDAGSDEEGDCVCDAGRYKDALAPGRVSTLTGGPSLYGFAGGPNGTARFRNPHGMAVSSDGRYAVVSDHGNHVLRLVDLETANTTTLAGMSDRSWAGYANGARDAARFYYPRGVAIVGSTVLVADTSNHVIRQVDMATGFTSTLAGHPSSRTNGYQDGSAASARFYNPWDVAISGDGSVAIVADFYNHCLRKIIVATGHTSTLTGSRTSGHVDGAAGDARFSYPSSLAMLEDSVYVIDQSYRAIRRTDLSTGQTSTLVSGAWGSMYGIGMGAGVDGWRGVVSIDYGLYRLNVGTGAMELLAGHNGTGYGCGFVDGDGPEARFCGEMYGISVTGDRAVVVDSSNHAVRSVSMQPSCRACTAACGDGEYLSGICARGSTQDTVSCVACGAGTYKSGMSNATSCLACSASCGAGSYLSCRGSEDCAGCGAGTFQGNESSVATACTACVAGTYAQSGGASACSECPAGSYCEAGSAQPRECFDGSWSDAGSDEEGDCVCDAGRYKDAVTSAEVSTLTGGPSLYGYADGPNGTARFRNPHGVAVSSDGRYAVVSDSGNHVLRLVDLETAVGNTTRLAGSPGGYYQYGYVNGARDAARFHNPRGVASNGSIVLVADTYNHVIRQVDMATGFTSTLAGHPAYSWKYGYQDGSAASARFYNPWDVAISGDGSVAVVTDEYNHCLRKIIVATGHTSTLAGSTTSGHVDGAAGDARFFYPSSLAMLEDSVYVIDQSRSTIRRTDLSTGQTSTLVSAARGSMYGIGMGAGVDGWRGVVSIDYGLYRLNVGTGAMELLAGYNGTGYGCGFVDGDGLEARFCGEMYGISVTGDRAVVADYSNHAVRSVSMQPSCRACTAACGDGEYLSGPCARGSTQDTALCVACGAGTYKSGMSNATSCLACSASCGAGSYLSCRGSEDCAGCGAGTFQGNESSVATACTACVAGTYAQSGGASACSECPAGSYCEAGSAQPRECVPYSWSDAGSDEEGDCVCDAGRYKDALALGRVSTLTGGPSLEGYADGPNGTARFRYPHGVAVSSDGRYAVVSDYKNHVLRLVDLETAVGNTTRLAGSPGGYYQYGYVNGARDAARFYYPRGVASNGSIVLVADSYNHVIRQVDMATGFTSTLAGHPSSRTNGYQDGSAASARFRFPWDVAISGDGSVAVVSDNENHCLRKIIVATGHTSTLAGPGWRTSGLVDGAAGDARFYYPSSLAMLEDSVYVIDQSFSSRRAIRRTDLSTGQTSTLVSSAWGSMYGIGMGAGVDGWRGVVSMGYGLYRLNVETGAMELLAGYNGTGYGCGFVDGDGLEARFCGEMYGISVTGDRAVVADYSNHAVRSVSMQPSCRACTAACGDGQYLSGPCARGSTQDTVSCVACGAGTYKSGMSNATSCLACSASCGAGSYLSCRGSEDCAGCGAGTFQGNESSVATACTACVAGTYAQSGGASACSECPAGSYCEAGSAQPRECFDGSWSDAGSDEEGDCVCDAGRYKDALALGRVSTLTGGPSLYGNVDGPNGTARFRYPYGVAVSSDGRYAVVSEYGNHALRLVGLETANTTTLAGRSDGISSAGYVNGARDAARFYYPRGVAIVGSTVLIADTSNHVIRQVDMATGFTSTLAGHPSSRTNGYQDGSAASARFYYPRDVAISGDGSVAVVTDYQNHCLRKIIVATGHTSTLAGPGWRTSGHVDGAAGDARFYYPRRLAMLEDSVYVIDQSFSAIRRTDLITGQTSTLVSAARGSMYGIGMGAGVDGWRGVVSMFYGLYRLNVETGAMELLAGYNGTWNGYGFVDGDGLEARFRDTIYGISVTGDRAVVADYSNHAVRSVSMQPSCRACTAACGDGQYLSGPCARGSTQDTALCVACGAGTYKSGMSNATSCLACSASCGAGSHLSCRGSEDCAGCRAGTFQGNESSVATACTACVAGTYAQSGGASACSECPAGSYCEAGSAQPRECASYSWSDAGSDEEGDCVCDAGRYKDAVTSAEVSTLTGGPSLYGYADGPNGTARFRNPHGVAVSSDGRYAVVSDYKNHVLRLVDLETAVGNTTRLAGSPGGYYQYGYGYGYGYVNGARDAARFYYPRGVASNGSIVLVADSWNHVIRQVDMATGFTSTLAGHPSSRTNGYQDGSAASARFWNPWDVAISGDGSVAVVTDEYNHCLRKIIVATGHTSTLAGSTTSGHVDGAAGDARFSYPRNLAMLEDSVYVIDQDFRAIRRTDFSTGQTSTLVSSAWGSMYGIGMSAGVDGWRGVVSIDYGLYRLNVETGAMELLAGYNGTGYGCGFVDGHGLEARFCDNVFGISVTGDRAVVSDTNNHALRSLSLKAFSCMECGVRSHASIPSCATSIFALSIIWKVSAKDFEESYSSVILTIIADIAGVNPRLLQVVSVQNLDAPLRRQSSTGLKISIQFPISSPMLSTIKLRVSQDAISTKLLSHGLPAISALETTGSSSEAISTLDTTGSSSDGMITSAGASTCPAGKYLYTPGSNETQCLECPAGSYCKTGSAQPRACMPYSWSDAGSDEEDDCVCDAGRYKDAMASAEVSTLTGGASLYGSADGSNSTARFRNPYGVAVSSDGRYAVVSDYGNDVLRLVDLETANTTTLAGSYDWSSEAEYANGARDFARFNGPAGVAIVGSTVLVADSWNHVIRQVDMATGFTSTLAGHPSSQTYGYHDGSAASARFYNPLEVAISGDGSVAVVTDYQNHCLRKIIVATGHTSTLAGSTTSGHVDGAAGDARFFYPSSLAMLEDSVYVIDQSFSAIRRTDLSTGQTSTLVSGAWVSKKIGSLSGIALFDGHNGWGGILSADFGLYRLNVETGAMELLAGDEIGPITSELVASCPFADGEGSEARFCGLAGIAVTDDRVIGIDRNNHAVRIVSLQAACTVIDVQQDSLAIVVGLAVGLSLLFIIAGLACYRYRHVIRHAIGTLGRGRERYVARDEPDGVNVESQLGQPSAHSSYPDVHLGHPARALRGQGDVRSGDEPREVRYPGLDLCMVPIEVADSNNHVPHSGDDIELSAQPPPYAAEVDILRVRDDKEPDLRSEAQLGEPSHVIESNIQDELARAPQQQQRLPLIPHIAFEDITMGREIGNGAFKKVFKASWSREGKDATDVAILVLRQGDCDISQEIKMFETLGRHPNLTRLMATTRNAQGKTCLITEFAPWGSLDSTVGEFVEKGTHLEDTVLLTIAMQVCDGMRALRLHGIVHRDLAARNILVFGFHPSICRSVKVKISDYGLAIKGSYGTSYVHRGTSSSISGGKGPVRWSSPEAIQKGLFGEKSDVFSFGVLLWELWSECNIPFYLIQDDAEVARLVCEERRVLSMPLGCPESVYDLMQQTWRYAARQRPSFDDVRQELDACMAMVLSQAATTAAALNKENGCVVCMEEEATHAVVPCGHECLCEQCSSIVIQHAPEGTHPLCPICRSACVSVMKIYRAGAALGDRE